jgi:uncharacterized protein YbjT (DUF2867 family)
VERTVTGYCLPWLAVRPSSFAMNMLGMWRGQLALGDIVRAPYAGFAEAVIHERDVAEVIAQALLDDSLLGRRILLTGPEALRLDEIGPDHRRDSRQAPAAPGGPGRDRRLPPRP